MKMEEMKIVFTDKKRKEIVNSCNENICCKRGITCRTTPCKLFSDVMSCDSTQMHINEILK